jgi:hypothetical protein
MMAVALEVSMGEPLKNTPAVEAAPQGMARTRLGEPLLRIREQIVASGEPLLSWEDIEREVAQRRGEFEQQA